MKILKLKIYQPEVHYRIPYSYQRRFTYPIPPFSTVKGFLCNILGIKSNIDKDFVKMMSGLSIGIYGSYESFTKEYIWFRNLSKEWHNKRFGISTNRIIDGEPQHPGGQMPVKIDTLLNVNLMIYVYHPEYSFLAKIKRELENPKDRNSPLHLGRAEDWVVIKDVGFLENLNTDEIWRLDFFSWVPSADYLDRNFTISDYCKFFDSIQGIRMMVPVYYDIVEGQRIFTRYVEAKLFEGGTFNPIRCYVDNEENIPLILTRLGG